MLVRNWAQSGVIIGVLFVAGFATTQLQIAGSVISSDSFVRQYSGPRASIALSGDNNVYLTWWDNKTGDWQVFSRASTDNGKTFGDTVNISNSSDARSIGARMAAQGNNLYISWIGIKPGEKQVMFRSSNDNGDTFANPVTVYSSATGNATSVG